MDGFQGGSPPIDWEEMELLEEIYADINVEKAPRISKRRVKEHLVMHQRLAEVYNVVIEDLDHELMSFKT